MTIKFFQGYEFDELQEEHFMESLCHAMSDQKGNRDNNIWAAMGRDDGDLKGLLSAIFQKGSIRKMTDTVRLDPTIRLKETLGGVEKKAEDSVLPGEVLVFGHTHRPFINDHENLAKTGSWLTTAPIHNTYVRIEGGKPDCTSSKGEEIAERIDPKK